MASERLCVPPSSLHSEVYKTHFLAYSAGKPFVQGEMELALECDHLKSMFENETAIKYTSYRLSTLIDPQDLGPMDIIRSPSGRFYRVQEYLNNPDRPLSIRERQQHIRAAMAKREAAVLETKQNAAGRSPSVV